MTRRCSRTILFGWLCSILVLWQIAVSVSAQEVNFNRDVRPILSDRCFACHGPDANTREADLRLDVRLEAMVEREDHALIAPGAPEKSDLFNRINSNDDSERMPPADSGKPLTADEVNTIRKWIEQGAKWEDHWAYIPPNRQAVENSQPGKSPIDFFIRRQQETAGLVMNVPTDHRNLIRRLTFDLTGLPPTPDEVDEFTSNNSPQAYEQLVDKLLQSPHYGERMAIYWLDLVRYADTLGFHGDQVRSVSPYRDYVINAFNENMGFDQFATEQIAGDLIPNATMWQKVASTYNRLNRASGEGGVQPKEYLAKYSADRVRTAGTVWLGSTFGCAECHDHKFDPFTSKDFYSFAAYFADIKEQGIVSGAKHIEQMPVPTPEQQTKRSELSEKITRLEAQFNAESEKLTTALQQWKVDARTAEDRWQPLIPKSATSQGGATLTVEEDGVIAASGKNPDSDTYVIELPVEVSQIGALKLDVLSHDSLPAKGPGRAGNGNFVVQAIDAEVNGQKVEWASSTGTHSQGGFLAEHLGQGNKKGWAILPEVGKDHKVVLEAKAPLKLPAASEGESAAAVLKVTITQNHGTNHTLGRFRISVAEESAHGSDSPIPSLQIVRLLEKPEEQLTDAEEAELQKAFREQTPLLKEVREQLAQTRKEKEQLDASIVTTLVSVSAEPRVMRVLPRGNWMDDSGAVVEPAVPAFLNTKPQTEKQGRHNRMDLAEWITSPDNPLVARTFVNRLWMLYFGEGLSRSVDDLGSQGVAPTHPELLDWLAVEFVESGWDVKHIVKLIVMSETYRQSSVVSDEVVKKDPYNNFFARQMKRRLDAEMIRDNALAVSGLLVDKIGGVSVKPYQPAGYWAQLNFPKRTYQHDTGENQYRRGLYTHWQRTFLHPSMLAFDAPAREECTAKRARSNTPLQALVLLNDPTYIEAARVFAERISKLPEEDFNSQLEFAFRECLSRKPTSQEVEVLKSLFDADTQKYHQDQEAAKLVASSGLKTPVASLQEVEVAAWTGVARVLLNLHETITRY